MAGNFAIRDKMPEAFEELQSDYSPYQEALEAGDEQHSKLWYLMVTKSGQGSGIILLHTPSCARDPLLPFGTLDLSS